MHAALYRIKYVTTTLSCHVRVRAHASAIARTASPPHLAWAALTMPGARPDPWLQLLKAMLQAPLHVLPLLIPVRAEEGDLPLQLVVVGFHVHDGFVPPQQ